MSWIRGLLLWWNGVDPAARASKAMGIEGFRMFAMGIESLETQDRSLILQVQDIFKKEVELAAVSEDVAKWLARSCTQSWHCCTPCHMLRQGFSISGWLEEARPLFQAHWFDRFIMFDPSTGSTAKLWLAWVQHAQCIILYGHVTKSFLHWGKTTLFWWGKCCGKVVPYAINEIAEELCCLDM